ncbi:carbon monoxide dehydrogenase [Epidermidibacterium keratini]|uniref:Carbon monoxide dehydrogenase n=1 Tax=Epidermidibacterium keratini TaxID=1891644 RepID=A0A7L4YHD9_9ACTN|nr:carbon monoxide dehydrogenase subunit G [Epidermidibacterium keratini]QHB98984.1 carbon monoxide dehydrogenase [Epidermidibacterium keratini]
MKVAGSAVLNATPDKVWEAINDPAVLAEVIPGCEKLTEVAPAHYQGVVSMGIASIKGTYQGEIKLEDQKAPDSLVLKAAGAGSAGTIDTTVDVQLKDLGDGTTEVSYDADAVVGGMVGGVGQRVLSSVAKKTAGAFFNQIDAVLTGKKQVGAKAASDDGAPAEVGAAEAPAAAAAGQGGALGSAGLSAGASGLAGAAAGGAGSFALGAVCGALTMAVGVVIGSRVSRRR